MKQQQEEIIKIKAAISLRTLLKRNKDHLKKVKDDKDIVDSYEKIAIAADIRKATVTLAFSGVTRTAMTTVVLIVEAMGFSIKDYSDVYEIITDQEISTFKENKNN